MHADWISIELGVKFDFDLEKTPLYLKTDSVMVSNEEGKVGLYTAEGNQVGGVLIKFSSPPLFAILYCTDWTNLPTGLPSDDDKVWKITLTRSAGIKVIIHCNNVEVLNMQLSDSTCAASSWHEKWRDEVKKIEFPSDNRAYDLYSSQPGDYP